MEDLEPDPYQYLWIWICEAQNVRIRIRITTKGVGLVFLVVIYGKLQVMSVGLPVNFGIHFKSSLETIFLSGNAKMTW